jgi:sigma-54 dependent transcriptional regulator, acetoin dehydrogenase operon transcriptional activator AcoR
MTATKTSTNGTADATNGRERSRRNANAQPPESAAVRTWERFVAGEELDCRLRPEILASWLRCRDDYKVDPWRDQAPPATAQQVPRALEDDVVLAELAGVAKSIEAEVDDRGALVAVADGDGSILTAWGDRRALDVASERNLAPRYTWSERNSGTNGLGTALENDAPTLVRQSEHWCAGFHDWTCAGIAIRDPSTGHPLGVLDISSLGATLPENVLSWLRMAVSPIELELLRQASHAVSQLLALFAAQSQTGHGLVAAADNGGRVVAANDEGRRLLAFVMSAFGTPASPGGLDPEVPELTELIRLALSRARADSSWFGSGQLVLPVRGTEFTLNFRPATVDERVVGVLITSGAPEGECLTMEAAAPATGPTRILGIRARRLILLSPPEIRFAEADGNTVWIDTDQGRIRAFARGLGVLEEKLSGDGFVRVHRRFLVNLSRVREIAPSFKGGFDLIMDAPSTGTVQVSRRRAAQVRSSLGL